MTICMYRRSRFGQIGAHHHKNILQTSIRIRFTLKKNLTRNLLCYNNQTLSETSRLLPMTNSAKFIRKVSCLNRRLPNFIHYLYNIICMCSISKISLPYMACWCSMHCYLCWTHANLLIITVTAS